MILSLKKSVYFIKMAIQSVESSSVDVIKVYMIPDKLSATWNT